MCLQARSRVCACVNRKLYRWRKRRRARYRAAPGLVTLQIYYKTKGSRPVNTGVKKVTPVFTGRVGHQCIDVAREHGCHFFDTDRACKHCRHFGNPRSRAVDRASEHGPWTRVVCTEFSCKSHGTFNAQTL